MIQFLLYFRKRGCGNRAVLNELFCVYDISRENEFVDMIL